MSSPVDKIKERLSIADVVSSYITLEQTGKNFKAKCPFHNEKTPSFFVSVDRGTYYCFGCGAKGDIFSFVQNFEGIDFLGSLKILADRAGVPLIYDSSEKKEDKEIYYRIMEEVTLFFEEELNKNTKARDYILSRGINEENLKRFRLGYSLNEWRSLFDYLLNKGYQTKDIEKVGLIKENKGSYYDRFRGRIMFPINDSSGRVVAFTGRIFDENNNKEIEEAKYINSPETPLYTKSSVFFGIDKAKIGIRSFGYTIVVEGQIDLILSHQIGFNNTVAVSGTAFVDSTSDNDSKVNHLGLIKRISPNLIFALDGDKAGLRALNRSAMIALSLDMQVKLAIMPIDKDPADIIKEDPDEWKSIIKNSTNVISFYIDRIHNSNADLRARGRELKEKVFPFIYVIKSQMEKSAYFDECNKKLGISMDAIISDYKDYELKQKDNIFNKDLLEDKKLDNKSKKEILEQKIFGIIFWTEGIKDLNVEIKELIDGINIDNFNELKEKYKNNSKELAFEAEIWYGNEILNSINDFKELILNLEEEVLNEKLFYLKREIVEKEKNKDKEGLGLVLKNYQKIVERIEKIKNIRI